MKKNNNRYLISYQESNGNWADVPAKTEKEARALYDMVGDEAKCKVLVDTVNGEVLEQSF